MKYLSNRRALLLAATFALASPVFAQATASCDPTGSVSGVVGKAQFSMARAIQAVQSNATPLRDLQETIRLLIDDKTDNTPARNYLLGEAYVLLLTQPGIKPITTRGAIGLTTNPTGALDLFASTDSAFRAFEATKPDCASLVREWRQQKPWLTTLNDAIGALNAGKLDSAEYLANRALLLDTHAPYAYSVLASVASQRKNSAAAMEFWKKALDAAGTDTSYTDVKVKTMFDIANAASNRYEAATGAEKKALAKEAVSAWQEYLALATSDYLISDAIDRLSLLYTAAGDTASIPKLYAGLIANPSKYGELSLLHAGVVATRANRAADAAKLFESTIALNAYSRDALNNLAASYIQLHDYAKAFPLINRLIAIDPSNPDNVLLYAFAYQGMYKGTKDKKAQKVYSDSLMYYNSRSENMKVKVTITEFTRGDTETVLGGTIENMAATPKSYTLSVEFVDKAGSVIGSQDVPVGPVAPKSTQKFKVTIPKGGVYGFRYKPLN